MTPALQIAGLHAWYGDSHVLHGVDLTAQPGEVVTLLGRNGAGRTSTLRAVFGLTGSASGSVRVNGKEILGLPTHRIAQHGLGYCPEERAIFGSLSCEENLLLPPTLRGNGNGNGDARKRAGMPLEEIYEMFPNLRARRDSPGGRLSGGEQQMLAVARILRTGANLLLLDEISEGLAPVIVQALARTIQSLKKKGYTILMVEQNFRFAAPLADRFYVMEGGRIVDGFTANELHGRSAALEKMLGL